MVQISEDESVRMKRAKALLATVDMANLEQLSNYFSRKGFFLDTTRIPDDIRKIKEAAEILSGSGA